VGCEYAWQGREVLKTFRGFVSGHAFIETTEVVAAHPRFDLLRIIYNDFSRISGHSIDAETYKRVGACRLGSMVTNPNFRVVFIAGDAHAQAIRQAVDGWLSEMPFHPVICASLDDAHAWFDQQTPLSGLRGFTSGCAPAAHRTNAR
jgi:hypothetical protein